MKIGIVSPITIGEFVPFLDDKCKDLAKSITGMKAPAVDTIIMEFVKQGHHVVIFTLDMEVDEHIHLYGDNIDIFVGSNKNRSWWRFSVFIYRMNEIRALFKMNQIKLDVIHAQWTREYALAACSLKDKFPVVVTVRDWQPVLLKNSNYNLSYLLLWIMDYLVFKTKGIHIVANSKYICNRIKQRWGFDTEYFNNPISQSFFEFPLNNYKKEPLFTIITVSNGINPNKNIERLLKGYKLASSQIGKSQLLLVGNDFVETHPTVMKWKSESLLDGCVLCGSADRTRLIDLLDIADVLFHPSLEESFGNVLIEGLARGLRVIGGENSGAVPYVLENGKLGGLCDIMDVNRICEKIIDAYNNNVQYKQNSSIISEHVKQYYSSDEIAHNMIDYYTKCIQNHVSKK